MMPSTKKSSRYSNRLMNILKNFFSGKQREEAGINIYKRDYDRFPMEFDVLVTLIDSNGEKHIDKAELHDVSGSGALFFTRMPEKYHINQALHLRISLAGTDDVRGCIKAESTVVRIQQVEGESTGHDSPLMGVAVKFLKTFEFERVDKNFFGDMK